MEVYDGDTKGSEFTSKNFENSEHHLGRFGVNSSACEKVVFDWFC